MLALGTVLGTAFGMVPLSCFRNITLRRGRLLLPEGGVTGGIYSRAVNGDHSGSGMTDNYQLILPMIITGLGATH